MQDLKSLSLTQLGEELNQAGFPAFRATQIYHWLHVQMVQDVDEMTNIPKILKEYLKRNYILTKLKVADHQVSHIDGTQKFLFALPDSEAVESVFMKYHYGCSVCVSSQVGCRMGCTFCASTLGGLVRGLLPGEMIEQVYSIERITGEKVSHVVIMGTGEPMDNYDNVVQFIRLLTDEQGHHLSARNVTISTCGIVPRIYDFANENLPVTLSLSLHATTDEKRQKIMPIAKKYSIHDCVDACRYYAEKTGRRITFEYSMIHGVNDGEDDAEQLSYLAKSAGSQRSKMKGKTGHLAPFAHVNLIPVNPVTERKYEEPDAAHIQAFSSLLEKNGIHVSIRRVLGRDIDGACGQLRRRYLDQDTAGQ